MKKRVLNYQIAWWVFLCLVRSFAKFPGLEHQGTPKNRADALPTRPLDIVRHFWTTRKWFDRVGDCYAHSLNEDNPYTAIAIWWIEGRGWQNDFLRSPQFKWFPTGDASEMLYSVSLISDSVLYCSPLIIMVTTIMIIFCCLHVWIGYLSAYGSTNVPAIRCSTLVARSRARLGRRIGSCMISVSRHT